MAKKQDSFYYENFSECAACACQAAHYLEDALKNFKPEGLSSMLDELHQVEHAADEKKHELSNVLARAFITPIEREDIILLSQSIDEITDKIEDVMLRLYCNNVQTIRPDAIEMGAVLIHCCEEVRKLIDEFADFRRSKKLREYIIHINTMEEQADKLFIDSMRRLHTSTSDPIEIISWRERRCLRTRRRRRGKRDYEEYLSRSAAVGGVAAGQCVFFYPERVPFGMYVSTEKAQRKLGFFLWVLWSEPPLTPTPLQPAAAAG